MIDPSSDVLAVDQPELLLGRVLVIDDERNIRATLQMVLTSAGYRVDTASNGTEADLILSRSLPDVILLDVRLPGKSGLQLLEEWRKQWPDVPVILMSGEASLTEALNGLKQGAFDFLEKPILSARLLTTVSHALKSTAKASIPKIGRDSFVTGTSTTFQKVLTDAKKIAETKARVLISGESGTGKDVLARFIHQSSARSKNPFIKINCASIPADLVESELFGHVKGAFTGASSARRGHFEAAHGGTLFLDEVGELPLAAQAKMLRTLQCGEVTLVGTSDPISVDVRVIAATNRDLRAEVARGTFREDLFYRLAVVTLESPALRTRAEDIPLLAETFVKDIADDYGMKPKLIDSDALSAMIHYSWPGNIRELRNVIERIMILGGATVSRFDLPPEISSCQPGTQTSKVQQSYQSDDIEPWHVFKERSERAYIERAINLSQGNISEAARRLGVERQTIHKWIRAYNIERMN